MILINIYCCNIPVLQLYIIIFCLNVFAIQFSLLPVFVSIVWPLANRIILAKLKNKLLCNSHCHNSIGVVV